MKVNYLGPLALGVDHLAPVGVDYGLSCFAVEVGCDACLQGDVIEGDVLVVDEAQRLCHDDLTVVEVDDALCPYKTFRVGPRFRLLPLNGGTGLMATAQMVRGVVVKQVRCHLDEMA